jgi:large subunit ribosomal protein L24
MAQRIKKGDTVMVLSGKDGGKKGKVIEVLDGSVIVEKINIAKKHKRPTQKFQGGIIEMPKPVSLSKVMLVCPKCNEPNRLKFSTVEDRKVRVCKGCNEVVDKIK